MARAEARFGIALDESASAAPRRYQARSTSRRGALFPPVLTRRRHELTDVDCPLPRAGMGENDVGAHGESTERPPEPWRGAKPRFTFLPTPISRSQATDRGRDA
jgi:hypothetical protein